MNKIRILFQIFLIVVFLAGLYVVATYGIKKEGMENKDEPIIPENCPDLLVSKGNKYLLFDTRKPKSEGSNPIEFNSLDDYKVYLENQRSKGLNCPVLFLKREYDTQGEEVYRQHPSPIQLEGGIRHFNTLKRNESAINAMLHGDDTSIPLYNPTNYAVKPPLPPSQYQPPATPPAIPIIDASRENGNYNANNYAGFDPTSLYIGKYTVLDKIHDSTELSPLSDNAMDPNWGGISHTQQQVDSGKYDENIITKPRLFQPKGTFDPTIRNGFPLPKDVI